MLDDSFSLAVLLRLIRNFSYLSMKQFPFFPLLPSCQPLFQNSTGIISDYLVYFISSNMFCYAPCPTPFRVLFLTDIRRGI